MRVVPRTAKWLFSRLGLGAGSPAGRGARILLTSIDRVRALIPDRPVLEALTQEDDDCGVARFNAHVTERGLDDEGLSLLRRRWRQQALAWLCWSALPFALGAIGSWAGEGLPLAAIGPLVVSSGFLIAALRADFHAWQIEQRRYAAAHRYLRKLPLVLFRRG